jgi:hypothetical protein
VFNTPFGRYYFKRLAMGLTSAPEVFHRTVQHILEGREGARNFIDDVIIWGKMVEEHDARMWATLERLKQVNTRLNLDKCRFRQTEIEYLRLNTALPGKKSRL